MKKKLIFIKGAILLLNVAISFYLIAALFMNLGMGGEPVHSIGIDISIIALCILYLGAFAYANKDMDEPRRRRCKRRRRRERMIRIYPNE